MKELDCGAGVYSRDTASIMVPKLQFPVVRAQPETLEVHRLSFCSENGAGNARNGAGDALYNCGEPLFKRVKFRGGCGPKVLGRRAIDERIEREERVSKRSAKDGAGVGTSKKAHGYNLRSLAKFKSFPEM